MNKRILSIGSYNAGLTCKTSRVPSWGETIIGSDFSESYGGKGSNQAVASANLGGDTTFIGCLGNDSYATDGIRMLNNYGVDTSHVKYSFDKNTGVGIILLNDANDNCIIVDPGANSELKPEDMVNLESVISDAGIVIFQLEIPLDTVGMGMEIAQRLDKKVILDPAPANKQAIKLLRNATIVTPNETELLLLNGKSTVLDLSHDECKILAQNLLNEGPEAVVVTRGEKGCFVVTKDSVETVPSLSAEVVDTTGAGDVFTGALAVALAENESLVEATKFANIAGSYAVTKYEVIPGIPTREDMCELYHLRDR
ncbi:ribokinase [Tetragenococcus muriaticus]|uniref:ribokinase n=1 Tax=Tetragenococcus muriaticus TaxID=64642 RepID=UPI00056EB362|nr:ribokinase [Tetragenococcus muriaticus]GMA48007.1 ribokinase [Tetragenococcus muriaticus]